MNTRVVVTGMGAITPIGNSVEAFWTAVKSNTVGIAPITHFDTADFKCKLAAEVKDFDPKQYNREAVEELLGITFTDKSN